MSTNDLNTNNASQTLFRFATMRNPELSDPRNIEKRFIFRDEDSRENSAIDKRVSATTSLQKLFQDPGKITGFTLLTEEDLKTGDDYAPFYEYAVWVARNKATATRQEFDLKMKACKADHGIPVVNQKIWDNLVYQVITRKEFYAKELLMQILHLHHILSVYDFTEESYQEVIKAKVVLPKELFREPGSTGTSSGSQQASKTMRYDNKSMKMAEAGIELRQSRDLSASLKKMQEAYKKQYDTAYQQQYADYQEKAKPLQKQLQKETAAADNKKQILENRINYLTQLSVADPEKFYANSELDMEMHRIKDEILNIPSSEVEIPEFIFTFGPEIDAPAIERALGTEDKSTLCRVFGVSGVPAALSGVSTFEEINRAVEQHSQSLQQKVLDNTVLNEETYANIGGVIVPVSNTSKAGSGAVIPFIVKTRLQSLAAGHTMIVMTDSSDPKQIVSGKYKLKVLNDQDLVISSTISAYGVPNITGLFTGTDMLADIVLSRYEIIMLEGEVVLNDGVTYIMKGILQATNNGNYKFEGEGTFTPKNNATTSNQGSGTSGPETPAYPGDMFIPSGFGMKNIGVADYKKVEQSTYCYAEGEVAHIENIMAREYKERSTRRFKRSESQTTKSSESEKEKLTDTTSTERFEMQNEVAKVLQESKDFAAQAGATANWGGGSLGTPSFGITANASYATHNSKEESNRQAVTEAKDVTARALDRIVTKVKEERIDKILEEFEENNKHGFDNTKGNSHVVGVFRWVDKVVKNQIYNYGKRMMFEFMIPEPAKLHRLGMTVTGKTEPNLVKPVDPRESPLHKLDNFSSLLDDTKLKFWLTKYNIEVDDFPKDSLYVGKSFSFKAEVVLNNESERYGESVNVEVPAGYEATGASTMWAENGDGPPDCVRVIVGDQRIGKGSASETAIRRFQNFVPISYSAQNHLSGNLAVSIRCEITRETKNAWLQKTFNKIIEAYQAEQARYEQAVADIKKIGSNPGFYRQIENTILRRNCISYMINQDPDTELTFGKKRYYTHDRSAVETFTNTDILVKKELDQYAAFVKFMEQAFEWEIMSYHLYPYYWGERKSWSELYQSDDNDPIFRAFMQSGMARVIVTVRPGFEEAVSHFTATGQIWNGGEVPVIDDPLFLSLVDEMRSPEATKEGEPWRERIPTSLTILQADSIGLKVEKALPCHCEPGVKFNDTLGEMCDSGFVLNSNQIGQPGSKWIEITYDKMDDPSLGKMGEFYHQFSFPRTYECLGNTIEIEKSFSDSDPGLKFYQKLAEEISQIEGVEAYATGENGITFKVNVSLIRNFDFRNTSVVQEEAFRFAFSTDAETYVKIQAPTWSVGQEKVRDKNGTSLSEETYEKQAPFSAFSV